MTTAITIYPEQPKNLSPYQQRQDIGYDAVNEDFLGEGGVNFKSMVDIINPLQQLPVISTAYREITGDTISTGSRLIGGALLGGPIGFVVALANEIIIEDSGKDIGGNLFAFATGQYQNIDQLA